MQFRHLTFDEIDSTNLGIKRAIDAGQTEGLVVRAASQLKGYGRQGRTWASPEGGLYFSVLLRPSVRLTALPSLSLATAVASCRAFRNLLPADAYESLRIKWPNDIIIAPEPAVSCASSDVPAFAAPPAPAFAPVAAAALAASAASPDPLASAAAPAAASAPAALSPLAPPPTFASAKRIQKLSGISLEAHRGAVCLGIGVNVLRPDEAPVIEGKNAPIYLADLGFTGGVDEVFDAVLKELSRVYEQWREFGFEGFVREFDELMAYRGENVEIRDIAGRVCAAGLLQGIDEGGRLIIEQNGAQSFISSGELCPSGR